MRNKRKAIASETLEIINNGYYFNSFNKRVSIADEIKACVSNTKLFLPEQLDSLSVSNSAHKHGEQKTKFEVNNETTLDGAERLANSNRFQKIGVLNFASAKNPGGGFLNGSQAQEESLARNSALYLSLNSKFDGYYNFHRNKVKTALYSDRMIYSPSCPVFRNDSNQLLDKPYLVDFLTSPAPNAGAVLKNERHNFENVLPTLKNRAEYILDLFARQKCDAIILGAWGCGVFKNKPMDVATSFFELFEKPRFNSRFKFVLFSVLDFSKQKETFNAFKSVIA